MDGRAASSTIGVILMVAATVLVAGTAGVYVSGTTDDLHEPPRVTVDVRQTTISQGAENCASLPGEREAALEVTLTGYQRADAIYVIAQGEGGESTKTVWDDPAAETVGETKLLANDNDGPYVDLGLDGGADQKLCPGEDVTVRFFARYDGQTLPLVTYDFS